MEIKTLGILALISSILFIILGTVMLLEEIKEPVEDEYVDCYDKYNNKKEII